MEANITPKAGCFEKKKITPKDNCPLQASILVNGVATGTQFISSKHKKIIRQT